MEKFCDIEMTFTFSFFCKRNDSCPIFPPYPLIDIILPYLGKTNSFTPYGNFFGVSRLKRESLFRGSRYTTRGGQETESRLTYQSFVK